MKELSIEEKAKRYDEAIERAKNFKSNPFAGYDGTDVISSLFPELKESEDERIRKAVIDAVETLFDSPLKVKMLEWLRKQGDQKYITEEELEIFKKQAYKEGRRAGIAEAHNEIAEHQKVKQKWSEDDEANINYLIDYCNSQENGKHPILTTLVARKLSNWLYRLKSGELHIKTVPNLEWTDLDENGFESVCNVLRLKLDESNSKPLIDMLLRMKASYCYREDNSVGLNEDDEKIIHLACEFIRHRAESNGSIGGVDYASNFELVEEPVHRTKADVDAAMQEVEEKSKAFTDANKGESAEEILAQIRGEEPILEVLAKYLDHVSHEEAMKTKGAIDRWFGEYYPGLVSEELEDAADKYSQSIHSDYSNDMFDSHNIYDAVIYGANWQKQRDEDEMRVIRELLDNFDKTCDEYHDAGFKHGQEALMKDAIHGRWIRNSIVLPCEFDNRFDDGKYVTIIIKEG